MFAFALFDERKGLMLLARDSFGIKPLYMTDDGDTIRVASSAKALLRSRLVSPTTNDAALAGLLVLGSVPEPLTAWSDIRSVGSGSTIVIDREGNTKADQYFSLAEEISRGEMASAIHKSTDSFAKLCRTV